MVACEGPGKNRGYAALERGHWLLLGCSTSSLQSACLLHFCQSPEHLREA